MPSTQRARAKLRRNRMNFISDSCSVSLSTMVLLHERSEVNLSTETEVPARARSVDAYEIASSYDIFCTMKNRDGLENNDNWGTPDWLYNSLNDEFHFDFDPCPLNANFDGLKIDWKERNFVNPPYNRKDKPLFIAKAYQEWQKGKTCVLLIPVATSTKQFHEIILPNAEIRFLKGRVAFKGYNTKGDYVDTKKGKHDSMVVVFDSKKCHSQASDNRTVALSCRTKNLNKVEYR